jgi:hypothetical protein
VEQTFGSRSNERHLENAGVLKWETYMYCGFKHNMNSIAVRSSCSQKKLRLVESRVYLFNLDHILSTLHEFVPDLIMFSSK